MTQCAQGTDGYVVFKRERHELKPGSSTVLAEERRKDVAGQGRHSTSVGAVSSGKTGLCTWLINTFLSKCCSTEMPP